MSSDLNDLINAFKNSPEPSIKISSFFLFMFIFLDTLEAQNAHLLKLGF
jgi:hypothetical protein